MIAGLPTGIIEKVVGKMEHMADSEQIKYIVMEARLWPNPKPSLFKFGSLVGNLCVTDKSFVFASFGTAGLFRTRRTSCGEPEDEVLDFSDPRIAEVMDNPGSMRVPLGAIRKHEVVRDWDFSWYLRMVVSDQGEELQRTFSTAAAYSK